jgi:NADH-quinone oxidoreductase subunit F
MGTGTMIVVDDQVNLMSVLHNLEEFFARESCGWCTPCRDGLPWVSRILNSFARGQGRPEEIAILETMTHQLGPGKTFCAHAPGAMEPLQSALKFFRSDFESGVAKPRAAA